MCSASAGESGGITGAGTPPAGPTAPVWRLRLQVPPCGPGTEAVSPELIIGML